MELKALDEDQDSSSMACTAIRRPFRRDPRFRAGTGVVRRRSLIDRRRAIGVELFRQSRLSIEKFGWQFWQTDTWDPVAGEFGARPFIWGTLYSSILALHHLDADRARHRHLHLRARARTGCGSRSCS